MPSDDWEKINLVNLEMATKMAFFGLVNLAILEDERPAFTSTERDSGGARRPGRGGAFLGIQPDYGGDGDRGVGVSSVIEGSPAARSGLEDGDVILEMDGRELSDLRALSELLGSKKPGDKVPTVVLRDGKKVELEVTLGSRD